MIRGLKNHYWSYIGKEDEDIEVRSKEDENIEVEDEHVSQEGSDEG